MVEMPGSGPEVAVIDELYHLLTYFVVCNDELHARDILPLATFPGFREGALYWAILPHPCVYFACPVCGIPEETDDSSASGSEEEDSDS
jgi:hypothetical protein